MREIDLVELKRIQLEILQEVHNFCEKENIFYSLTYGTLIGAIRHKGYIPWDDDIDICMPRPDYIRFLTTFNSTSTRYKAVSHETESAYPYSFGKVIDMSTKIMEKTDMKYDIGINIDIFPIDGVPDNEVSLKRQIKYRRVLDAKIVSISPNRSFVKNTILRLSKIALYPLSIEKIVGMMCRNASRYEYAKMDKVACVAFGSKFNHPIDKQVFSDKLLVQFENRKFYVMSGYDKYLRSVFGDYMKMPPKEKQISHHSFEAYYI